jgi:hypothetical protein
MKIFTKITTMLVVAVFAMLALAPSMAAAQSPYRPNFSSGTQVYVDPAVANHPDFPVSLSGLESKLKDAGSAHGVVYLTVVVQQTSERGGGNLAGDWLDQLLLRWSGANGFPSDKYVLMVWMRSATNPSEGWVAVNTGSDLKTYGLGKSMLDAADGPVVPAVRKYMPQDPKGAFLGIASGVNKVIDDYNAAQQSARERSDFMGQLPIYFVILLVAGGIGAFFFVRSRSAKDLKAQVEPLFNEWVEKMDSANALYLKLRSGYLGFVQDQSDWKGKFTGSTAAQYEAALTNFADFSARRTKANARLEEARKLAEKGDYKGVRVKLQDEIVSVTGSDIALEDATLFGGLVKKTDYKPSELLNSMATLFDQTNKALAGIMKSLNEALAAGSKLDAVQADIEMKWAHAGDKAFAPHKAEFDAINAEEVQVRLNYKSDPLAGKAAMLALVARAEAIQTALGGATTA